MFYLLTLIFSPQPGAFRVQTRKEGRTLHCRYDPREPGHYVINVIWSDDHLPGSPYRVFIAPSKDDLQSYLKSLESTA